MRRTAAGRMLGMLVLSGVLGGLAACAPDDPTEAATPGDAPRREPGFEEVGSAAGLDFHMTFLAGEQGRYFKINLYDHGAGVAIGDVDGDSRDDIYLLNQLGPNGLFRNRGDGTFEDVTASAGVALGDRISTSASFADIDNDGDQDLFVVSTRGGNTLFRNDGTGRFEDVTQAAGVAWVGHSQGVAFFDYDDDGFLDLLVTNTAAWTMDERDEEGIYHLGARTLMELVGSEPEPNLLYHNRGDGTFEDVTEPMGVATNGWSGDVAVFDYDGDGDVDLYVTNMFGESSLFRNDEGAHFTDVSAGVLGRTSWGAVGCKLLDYDGDGRLDLFVVDMHSDMWMSTDAPLAGIDRAAKYPGPEGPLVQRGVMTLEEAAVFREEALLDEARMTGLVFGNTLFRNLGGGRFDEVSDGTALETLWPWSIAAADFDLDGLEDVFLGVGMGYPFAPWDNELLMNRGGKFVAAASERGIAPRPDGPWLPGSIDGADAASSSRSAAVLDYDDDGRPDLVVNNFNERPYLYHNRFPARRWVAFRLHGTRSNRDAIGAVVRVTAGGRTQVRQVQPAGGYLAQSSLTLHFGLGAAETIEACEVIWPGGRRQVVTGVTPGKRHDVVEQDGDDRR